MTRGIGIDMTVRTVIAIRDTQASKTSIEYGLNTDAEMTRMYTSIARCVYGTPKRIRRRQNGK